SLKWSGDIRYRAVNSKESVHDSRFYQQFRLRLGFSADVNDSLKARARLATGSSAISTNQALGDKSNPGMPRRNFGVDHAYMESSFGGAGSFWIGRTPNPFWSPNKNQTLYDGDLSFEGLAF